MKKPFPSLLIAIGFAFLLFDCSDADGPGFVPGNVIVGFQKEVTFKQAYDFAGRNADSVVYAHGFYFYSGLPIDSLNYVANALTLAGFSNKGVFLDSKANRIIILLDYSVDKDNSALTKMLELTQNPELKFENLQAYKSMLLYIQPGTEKKWIKTHSNNSLIRYADLDIYINIRTN